MNGRVTKMANLKGGTWDKQIRNAHIRLNAGFSKSKHGTDSHLTHSTATREKREMYLKDFKQYAEDKGLEGKLNDLITEDNLDSFFTERLDDLAYGTQEDYIRGWSGLIQGLQQSNITIDVDTSFFNEVVGAYKEYAVDRGEIIGEPKAVTTPFHPTYVMGELSEPLGALVQLQKETGIRVSEAYNVINDLEKHLNDLKLLNIVGKGGQKYQAKIISLELKLMLLKLRENNVVLPAQSTYYRQLQNFGMSSHDIRAFYALELYNSKIESGLSHEESCLFVSKEINHHRIQITEYYIAKFA